MTARAACARCFEIHAETKLLSAARVHVVICSFYKRYDSIEAWESAVVSTLSHVMSVFKVFDVYTPRYMALHWGTVLLDFA